MVSSAANDRLIRSAEVRQQIGVPGNSGLYGLMNDPDPEIRFPRPIKIGHRSLWSERAVQQWIARQKARAEVAL